MVVDTASPLAEAGTHIACMPEVLGRPHAGCGREEEAAVQVAACHSIALGASCFRTVCVEITMDTSLVSVSVSVFAFIQEGRADVANHVYENFPM